MTRAGVAAALALGAAAALCPAAVADPIPDTEASEFQPFTGRPAEQRPLFAPDPPRHPFMAPNARSNLHVDAYQTDVNQGPGPLGRDMSAVSNFLEGVCASVTFDSRGRIVTVCVGIEGPKMFMLDATTLEVLASQSLPSRMPSTLSIFNDFAGGGYFYLDERDRAIVPTTTRHLLVVGQTEDGSRFRVERDYDLTAALPFGERIVSALPDWAGRIWFVSVSGVVGLVEPEGGAVKVVRTGEEISNSFAVDETGAVYVVTQKALYRFEAGEDGTPVAAWREEYRNSGISKPGQVHAGSGTTPTVMGEEHVAITDNADPMNVVVYRRAREVRGSRLVCEQPVFEKGASATDQSLVTTRTSIVAENNYGYTGPSSTSDGRVTAPGLERVDLLPGGGCRSVWRSGEIAPTVVPKLSLPNGLVYTYTKDTNPDDPWYLTALDFETGETVWKRLAGTGLGFNNNYAPVTLGPDGTAYVGVLGGLVALRDATPPPDAEPPPPRLSLWLRRLRSGGIRAQVAGRDLAAVESVRFVLRRRTLRRDSARPFRVSVGRRRLGRRRAQRLTARVKLRDGRTLALRRPVRARR